ncbi:hypothetical protein EN859_004910 [Mesorhizobium sp. M00.F.Ca.ET.216.01.1.1]|nr:hypothetical protein EN859_004910 [Mesorhizobium sp. M00.F.Ca.ET.216.01.1.1]TJW06572.1 MAG: hypothetical protein E5W82_27190 [Mesorhizobium sp.]TJW42314.1 MAG: hypothetical protein E5W83_22045 [Mesorhizobium sp.]
MSEEKRVFISYSHDSEPHKEWVRSLAEHLMKTASTSCSTSGALNSAAICQPSWRGRSGTSAAFS